MHGVIFVQMKRYVDENLGGQTWTDMLEKAGLDSKLYLASQIYPDDDMLSLLQQASNMTGKSVDEVLESFGNYIIPSLMKMYKPLLKSSWKTLDFLENVEQTIHTVVKKRNPGAKPGRIHVKRVSDKEIILIYQSERKLCALAKGMANGVAKYYQETIAMTEKKCMNHGQGECEFIVTVV